MNGKAENKKEDKSNELEVIRGKLNASEMSLSDNFFAEDMVC